MEESQDAPPGALHIDLDKVWAPLSIGIQRAYIFARLGVNAAKDSRLSNFHPPGLFRRSFVPSGAESQVSEFKVGALGVEPRPSRRVGL